MTTSIAAGSESVNRVGWIALASAFGGWMFDAMDLHLFTLVMIPALRELTGIKDPTTLAQYGGLIISVKLLCWGIGGVVFGVLADRIGRAKVMMITIIIYSAFTALSGLAQNWQQLMVYQSIAALGIGGEWAAGAALVVETWPKRYRARAVQAMQVAFVFGLILASLVAFAMADLGWRLTLAVGAVPAVFALLLRWFTPESEEWRELKRRAEAPSGEARIQLGSIKALFSPELRRRTLAATAMAIALMVGSWGGTTLFPALVQSVYGSSLGAAELTRATGIAFMAMNLGSLLGFGAIFLVVWIWPQVRRRGLFFVYCLGAWLSTVALYQFSSDKASLHGLLVLFGFFAIGGFSILALYITELFPLAVRATGQGFTWNLARIVTAAGPITAAIGLPYFGVAGVATAVASVFLVGLVAVLFAPETRVVAN